MDSMLATLDSFFFSPTPKYNMEIRKFLRAAFHDCMGGCDGSINLTKTDNRGLEVYSSVLNRAYSFAVDPVKNPTTATLFSKLSRGDFYVLSEQRALAWGIKNSNTTPTFTTPNGFTYCYGRVDSDPFDADSYEGTLPGGGDAWQTALNDVITGIPSLNEADLVRFLGLHGAGAAGFNNSGYAGPWGPVADKNVVNNHFYVNLLNYGFPGNTFNQVLASTAPAGPASPLDGSFASPPPPTTNIQWVHQGNAPGKMMLPVDMQVYLSFTPNATGGETSGNYCPQGTNNTLFNCTGLNSPTQSYLPLAKAAALALQYAKNNTLYIEDLIPAFLRMVNYGDPTTTTLLATYAPGSVCVNGVPTCLGDIWFAGCPGPAATC
jgi:hypothetical protein